MSMCPYSLAERVVAKGEGISKEEAIALMRLPHSATLDIVACGQRIRSAFTAERTFTCGIVNAKSGRCSEDCAFCAQSRFHSTKAPVYPLQSADTLFDRAVLLAQEGANRFGIVTSGHSVGDREIDTLCETARRITTETDLMLCASLGQLTHDRALRLFEAGFSSYHHNLETARSFFPAICTTHEYDEDIATVNHAQAVGFRVCCGGILGLGESMEQRVELAVTLRQLGVPSIPLNFLHPIAGTRLAGETPLAPFEALRAIAIFRYILPRRDIVIAGGREFCLGEYQSWSFMAGANGMMIGNYLTTQGRNMQDDTEMFRIMGIGNI